MKKTKLKNKIEDFYEALKAYRELLSQSRDTMVRNIRNGPQIEEMRSDLNRKHGALSKYIKKLGHNPYSSDIGGGPYPVYETALSNDILQRRGPCIDMALQDLEYILGRLEGISEKEFNSLITPRRQKEEISNLHKQYWKMLVSSVWRWIKDHILATVIAGVVLAVILALLRLN